VHNKKRQTLADIVNRSRVLNHSQSPPEQVSSAEYQDLNSKMAALIKQIQSLSKLVSLSIQSSKQVYSDSVNGGDKESDSESDGINMDYSNAYNPFKRRYSGVESASPPPPQRGYKPVNKLTDAELLRFGSDTAAGGRRGNDNPPATFGRANKRRSLDRNRADAGRPPDKHRPRTASGTG